MTPRDLILAAVVGVPILVGGIWLKEASASWSVMSQLLVALCVLGGLLLVFFIKAMVGVNRNAAGAGAPGKAQGEKRGEKRGGKPGAKPGTRPRNSPFVCLPPFPPHGADGLPDDANAMVNWGLENRDGATWSLETVASGEEIIPFLEKNRDPYVWACALGLNHDLSYAADVTRWIVQQPDCPNALAVRIFAHLTPEFYLDPENEYSDRYSEIIKEICDRDAKDGFPEDGMVDAPGIDRQAMMDKIAQIDAPRLAPPWRMLRATPSGPAFRTPYYVEEHEMYRVVIEV